MIKKGFSVLAVLAGGVVMVFVIGGIPISKSRTNSLSKIQTSGLPEYGIKIVGPTEATFDTLMSNQSQKTNEMNVDALKSSSVFVVNNSAQSIAALSVRWELLQADGRSTVHRRHHSGGLTVVSDAESAHLTEVILSNNSRLFSLLNTSGSSNRSFGFNTGVGGGDLAQQLSESMKVTISVDGVLFVDGTFVGPDTGDFFGRLKTELEAKTEVFAEIAQALTGNSEAMKRLEALAKGGKNFSAAEMVKQRYASSTLAMRKSMSEQVMLERINAELNKPRINLRKL